QQPTDFAKDNVATESAAADLVADVANHIPHHSEPVLETVVELSPELSPEPKQQQNIQTQTNQAAPTAADLFAQQQDIVSQAEDFGHQSIDYDQYQPVSLEDQASQAFAADYEPTGSALTGPENMAMQAPGSQTPTHQQTESKPNTSTADLIALRNKLKQSQRDEGEGAEQVKKSESATPFNLASMRKQNQEDKIQPAEANDKKQSQATPMPSAAISEPHLTPTNTDHNIDNSPPWSVDNELQVTPAVTPVVTAVVTPELAPVYTPVVSPFSAEKVMVKAESFDSSAHLDEENVGDVTLQIPAFLPDNQKVIKALQLDDWSKLIEDMQVTALTKQLALHSAFNQQGETVRLTLLETKAHLISDTARQQLKDALCLALNGPIDLEIELGQPINTPYALQVKVNQVRKEYAREVVKSDPGIQLLQQQFSAKVDEQSIQAR
ncbi:MAG: DNA polymerase-3 subunit gamma/tau, partial [Paraglaciecola sp.]